MGFDRRRVLRSIAATATVGAGGRLRTAGPRPFAGQQQRSWEWSGGANAAFAHGLRTDNGFLLVGSTVRTEWPREGWAVHLTADGEATWNEVYRSALHREWRDRENDSDDVGGPHYEDSFEAAVPDGRGGYVLLGWTYADSPAARLGWAVNVDGAGSTRWNRYVDLESEDYQFDPLSDAARIDDRVLAVGVASTATGMLGGDGLLLELAADGSVAWWSTLASVEKEAMDPRRDVFRSIVPHGDGYLLVGRAQPEETGTRGWAVRIAADGAVDWRRQYWRDPDVENRFVDGIPYGDGALLVGATGGDGWAVEVDRDGTRLDDRTYPGTTIASVAPDDPPVLAGRRNGRRWARRYDDTVLIDVDPTSEDDGASSEFRSVVRTGEGDRLFVGKRQAPEEESSRGWAVRGFLPSDGAGDGNGSDGNGADGDRGTDDADESIGRHLLVFSYADDHTGQYRFEASGTVERTDHAGAAPFDHRSVTVGDPEDEGDGATVTGGVAGGGDAYVISGALESFRLDRGGDHVFAYLDGAPLDEWTRANEPTHLLLTGGDPDGHVVSYSLEVTGSVARTGRAHEAPVDDDLVTVDPEDAVDGRTLEGTLAGGNDACYYSGAVAEFRIDDCDHPSVAAWLDGDPVDPCALGN